MGKFGEVIPKIWFELCEVVFMPLPSARQKHDPSTTPSMEGAVHEAYNVQLTVQTTRSFLLGLAKYNCNE